MTTDQLFLTIITRHVIGREKLLARNTRTVKSQTCDDYEQIFLIDDQKRGMLWADRNLHANRDKPTGRYVYVLDDDDYLVDNQFIEKAKELLGNSSPAVIMVKFRRKPFNNQILPESQHWGKRPEVCHVGSPNFVVRRDVWVKYIHHFGAAGDPYSDFHFIRSIWDAGHKFVWLDRIVAEVDRIGHK